MDSYSNVVTINTKIDSKFCLMTTKKSYKEVTLQPKYKAIRGKKAKQRLSNKVSVVISTLSTWKKIFFEAFQTSSIKPQRIKVGTFENINQMVYIIAWKQHTNKWSNYSTESASIC